MTRIEGQFKGYLDQLLFFQGWLPEKSNGTLVITHGQAEHSGCYHRLVEGLKDLNWTILAWDLRGHGRSQGKRGYAAHFNDYVLDFEKFLSDAAPQYQQMNKPFVVLGHSMGGLIQEKTFLGSPLPKITAQVLSSPLFGLAVQVPVWKDKASRFIYKVLPEVTMGNELKYSQLTRDPEIQKEYDSDPLRHDQISSGVYLGMVENMAYVQTRASQIKVPTFMQVSGRDSVVNAIAAQEFFEKLGSEQKKMKVYKDSMHESYNDLDREEVFTDLKNFLGDL